jgi:hypothetical protein
MYRIIAFTMPKRFREDPLGLLYSDDESSREYPEEFAKRDRLRDAKFACQQTSLQANIARQNLEFAETERDDAHDEARKYLIGLIHLGVFGQSLTHPDNAYQRDFVAKTQVYRAAVTDYKIAMDNYHRAVIYYSELLDD